MRELVPLWIPFPKSHAVTLAFVSTADCFCNGVEGIARCGCSEDAATWAFQSSAAAPRVCRVAYFEDFDNEGRSRGEPRRRFSFQNIYPETHLK